MIAISSIETAGIKNCGFPVSKNLIVIPKTGSFGFTTMCFSIPSSEIEKLDHNRRAHHERAIIGVKRLNRFAEMEGVEKIFTGDVEDRYAIADFCRDVTVEMFDDRTGRNLSMVHPKQTVDDELERD